MKKIATVLLTAFCIVSLGALLYLRYLQQQPQVSPPPDNSNSIGEIMEKLENGETVDDPQAEEKKRYAEALKRSWVYLSPGSSWLMPCRSCFRDYSDSYYQIEELKIEYLSAEVTKKREGFDLDGGTLSGAEVDSRGNITNDFSYYVVRLHLTNLSEERMVSTFRGKYVIYSRYGYAVADKVNDWYHDHDHTSEQAALHCEPALEYYEEDSDCLVWLEPGVEYTVTLVFPLPDSALENNSFYLRCKSTTFLPRYGSASGGYTWFPTPVVGEGNVILAEDSAEYFCCP